MTQLKKKLILFAANFLIIAVCNFAQAPAIEWQNTIGGSGYEFLNSIGQTSDGGYILGGYSESNISGDKTENNIGGDDYYIVKLNAAGSIQWENTIGGGNFDRLYSVEETQDGGYILGGQSMSGGGVGDKSESNIGGYDYWVVKLNSSGTVVWQNTIGGIGHDQLYNAQPTSDGGYILAGSSDSGLTGDKTEDRVGNTDFWIIKLDELGNISWQNDIGGLMNDIPYSAYETSDGGFIVSGTSTSGISGDKTQANFGVVDYWIVKLTSAGTVSWDRTFGGSLNDYLYSGIPTAEGGSILVGMSESGTTGNKTEATNGLYDFWLIKLDASGNITWQNSIGGTSNDYVFTNPVDQTAEGGYIIAGYSQSGINGDKTEANTGSWDYWILKLTAAGAISWQTVLGGASGDYANAVSVTADGGYVIGGYSYSLVSGEKTEATNGDADYWIIKLEGTGCVPFAEMCNGLDDNCNGTIDDGVIETVSILAGGATTFCQGGSVLLTATYSGTSVQWKKNGATIPGATSSTYSVIKPGNYTAVTTSTCGSATSLPIAVNVFKNPAAAIVAGGPTTFCTGGSVTLTETPLAGCTYQWYKGAALIAGATGTNYIATASGNYKCRVTKTATGCFKNSNVIAVSVTCKEGMNVFTDNIEFEIYPNPNNGNFTISAPDTSCKIRIYNSIGELIYSATTENVLQQIQLDNIQSGIYFVRMQSGNNYSEQKLVVE